MYRLNTDKHRPANTHKNVSHRTLRWFFWTVSITFLRCRLVCVHHLWSTHHFHPIPTTSVESKTLDSLRVYALPPLKSHSSIYHFYSSWNTAYPLYPHRTHAVIDVGGMDGRATRKSGRQPFVRNETDKKFIDDDCDANRPRVSNTQSGTAMMCRCRLSSSKAIGTNGQTAKVDFVWTKSFTENASPQ